MRIPKEITLKQFIETLQEKATEEQLNMPLQSIGAGSTGFWHVYVGEGTMDKREEIKVPIYQKEV